MHSETCIHQRDTYPHTDLDGSVRTIPYCRHCGMEWTEPVNSNTGRPIMAAHAKGHPTPAILNGAMAAAWGWFAWQGIDRLTAMESSDYAGRFVAAWVTLALMGMAYLNIISIVTHKTRCAQYHAAQAIIAAALEDFDLTPEMEKEITEARRG